MFQSLFSIITDAVKSTLPGGFTSGEEALASLKAGQNKDGETNLDFPSLLNSSGQKKTAKEGIIQETKAVYPDELPASQKFEKTVPKSGGSVNNPVSDLLFTGRQMVFSKNQIQPGIKHSELISTTPPVAQEATEKTPSESNARTDSASSEKNTQPLVITDEVKNTLAQVIIPARESQKNRPAVTAENSKTGRPKVPADKSGNNRSLPEIGESRKPPILSSIADKLKDPPLTGISRESKPVDQSRESSIPTTPQPELKQPTINLRSSKTPEQISPGPVKTTVDVSALDRQTSDTTGKSGKPVSASGKAQPSTTYITSQMAQIQAVETPDESPSEGSFLTKEKVIPHKASSSHAPEHQQSPQSKVITKTAIPQITASTTSQKTPPVPEKISGQMIPKLPLHEAAKRATTIPPATIVFTSPTEAKPRNETAATPSLIEEGVIASKPVNVNPQHSLYSQPEITPTTDAHNRGSSEPGSLVSMVKNSKIEVSKFSVPADEKVTPIVPEKTHAEAKPVEKPIDSIKLETTETAPRPELSVTDDQAADRESARIINKLPPMSRDAVVEMQKEAPQPSLENTSDPRIQKIVSESTHTPETKIIQNREQTIPDNGKISSQNLNPGSRRQFSPPERPATYIKETNNAEVLVNAEPVEVAEITPAENSILPKEISSSDHPVSNNNFYIPNNQELRKTEKASGTTSAVNAVTMSGLLTQNDETLVAAATVPFVSRRVANNGKPTRFSSAPMDTKASRPGVSIKKQPGISHFSDTAQVIQPVDMILHSDMNTSAMSSQAADKTENTGAIQWSREILAAIDRAYSSQSASNKSFIDMTVKLSGQHAVSLRLNLRKKHISLNLRSATPELMQSMKRNFSILSEELAWKGYDLENTPGEAA